MNDFLDPIINAMLCLSLLLFVRNHLVYRIRRRRLNEMHDQAMALIEDSKNQLTVEDRIKALSAAVSQADILYASLNEPTYDTMLVDLTRWTYAQFYSEQP